MEDSETLQPKMLALGEVNLVERGTGPALLLLHGNGRTWQDWRPQLSTLTDQFRCIAYDQRGYGRSTLNGDLLSLVQLADDAAEVLDRLGIDRAHVAGISMGAQVAQVLARRHPNRVDRLVLGGSPYLAEDFEPPQDDTAIPDLESMSDGQLRDYADTSLSRLKQHGAAPTEAERNSMVERLKEMRDDPAVKRLSQRRFCSQELTLLQDYEQIAVPTLVVHGEADELPAEGASRMAERIPGGELVELPGANHISNMEPTSALFDDAVRQFLTAQP